MRFSYQLNRSYQVNDQSQGNTDTGTYLLSDRSGWSAEVSVKERLAVWMKVIREYNSCIEQEMNLMLVESEREREGSDDSNKEIPKIMP